MTAFPSGPGHTGFPFGIVGFDLDGTLLDTSFELNASLNHALASIGRPLISNEETRHLVGRGAVEMLRRGLAQTGDDDPALVIELTPILLEHYAAHLGSNSPPFPGLIDALDRLANAGVVLGVVTNKLEYLARTLLTNVGLIDRFHRVLGGDTLGVENMKPKPDLILEMLRQCEFAGAQPPAVFIGDSEHDTGAAHAAHIPCVAVDFGFLAQPVDSIGADAVIHHYDELIPTLLTLSED